MLEKLEIQEFLATLGLQVSRGKKDSQESLGYLALMVPKDKRVVLDSVDFLDLQDSLDPVGMKVLLDFLAWMALMDYRESQESLVCQVLKECVVKFWVLSLVLLVSLEDQVSQEIKELEGNLVLMDKEV